MDNAHPSRNGTIQLIVAVILTKTVILYCSYLYPYMQEFCAGSLVHGMMSSFYTVWCEICGIQCTYSGTFTNYFGLYFLACITGIIVLHFSGEKARAKWAKSAKNAQKDVIAPMPSTICVWRSSRTSLLPMLVRKTLKRIACYAGYVFPSTWKMITGNWQ